MPHQPNRGGDPRLRAPEGWGRGRHGGGVGAKGAGSGGNLRPEAFGGRDDGVVAAVTAQTAPENMVPVVQLPESNEEFRDSRDIDPAAAASAADRIAEFASASEEMLNVGMSEGPRHGAIIQSGVPLEFLRGEQEEEAVWKAQF